MKPFMTFSYADNIGWVTLQFHGTLHVLIFHFSHKKTVYEGGKRFIFTELKKKFSKRYKRIGNYFFAHKKAHHALIDGNSSCRQSSSLRSMAVSSTSNIKTALPGILGGAPEAPYPSSGGITNFRFSPTHIL